jgi:hypothetical protein
MAASSSAAVPEAAAACLQSLPHELLLRVVACCAPWASPELLFALGGLCAPLRAALACPSVGALRPAWARAIIAAADPCAALARADDVGAGDADEGLGDAYAAHAAAHGGWFALAHALTARRCVACGVVTPWVAWRVRSVANEAAAAAAAEDENAARNALCRCCESCAPPPRRTPHGHASASSSESAPSDEDEEDAASADDDAHDDDDDDDDDDDASSDEDYIPDFRRCTLINAHFFAPRPRLVLEADALPDPGAALAAAVAGAHDGDTIGLRGAFVARALCLGGGNEAAVRLLGLPASAPYRNVHAAAAGVDARAAILYGGVAADALLAALSGAERAAAAAVAFPAASIVVERGALTLLNPAWLESVFVRSGDARRPPPRTAADAFRAVVAFTLETETPPPSLVLRRCWVSAYAGTGVDVRTGCAARCWPRGPRCWPASSQTAAPRPPSARSTPRCACAAATCCGTGGSWAWEIRRRAMCAASQAQTSSCCRRSATTPRASSAPWSRRIARSCRMSFCWTDTDEPHAS